MDPARTEKIAHQQILALVQGAQELGLDCYLRTPGHEVAVHVRPGDVAQLSIETLNAAGEFDLADVEFSYQPLEASMQAGKIVHCGDGELKPEAFAVFFAEHPLESIQSLKELARLLDSHFGSGADWRVYSGFLQALPDKLSEDTLQNLIVPLLSAGELAYIPEAAEALLVKHGWTAEQVLAHHSRDERRRRAAQQGFLEETDTPVSQIQTADDLFNAISKSMVDWGNYHGVHLVCMFIEAHQFTDTATFKRIISPFLNMFGPEGYENQLQSLRMCQNADVSNVPPYKGPAEPPYGEELGDS